MPVITRLSAVAATLVAGGGLMVAPAAADVRNFSDPAEPAGVIDIRDVRVDNSTARPERVAVKVRMRNIRFGDGMTVYVDTQPRDAGPEYKLDAFANSEFFLRRVDTWSDRGRNVRCAGDGVSLAAGRQFARFVFPRDCIGDPGRVRIAVHAFRDGRSDWARAARTWLGFVRR